MLSFDEKVVETRCGPRAHARYVTILTAGAASARPSEIEPPRHLRLSVSDIDVPTDGHVLPGAEHVERLLAFLHDWDRSAPLVIHCYAGVSRSPAAAFIGAPRCRRTAARWRSPAICAAHRRMRRQTRRFVALADRMLDRKGRMLEAVAAIGRGADCFESKPFAMELH